MMNFTKSSYYLENGEYIMAIKLKGQTHVNKIELKISSGKVFKAGGGL
jgi:hypothetical protein